MAQTLTDTEVEVIVLKAAWELIDSAVNYAVLTIGGKDPDTEIRFHSSIHQRFFNIALVDFLSRTDAKAPIPPTSYLEGLRAVARKPRLVSEKAITLSAHFARVLELIPVERPRITEISRRRVFA